MIQNYSDTNKSATFSDAAMHVGPVGSYQDSHMVVVEYTPRALIRSFSEQFGYTRCTGCVGVVAKGAISTYITGLQPLVKQKSCCLVLKNVMLVV